MREICDECFECGCYWQNNDCEDECQGQDKPCHEFRKAIVWGVSNE